jgi:hypothetical protein
MSCIWVPHVATPYPAAQENRRDRKEFHIPLRRSGKTQQKREESGL